MNRSFRNCFALLIAASLFTACGRPAEEGNSPGAKITETDFVNWPATQPTDLGSYVVTLRPEQATIERNEHFALLVSLDPRKDDPPGATDLKILVDADMPAHRHGMNTKPEITNEGNLNYRVDGMLFHMAGEWVITVDITQGETTERTSFPVFIE